MDYKIISELGNREINEDSAKMCTEKTAHCFVVCDGLGGHGKGELASGMAVDRIIKCFSENPDVSAERIAEAFEKAQAELIEKQIELHQKDAIKTTSAVLLFDEEKDCAIWGHIGDTRLYMFQKNKVAVQTLDHSVPQMLVMAGEIKKSKIRNHPDRNRLLRVLGTEWGSRKYEISEVHRLSECQAFLLCSDGFWEYITEKMMCKFLKKSSTSEEWLSLMLEEVRKNGSGKDMDNHTAIAIIL